MMCSEAVAAKSGHTKQYVTANIQPSRESSTYNKRMKCERV